MSDTTIIQMIPATDWHVVYEKGDNYLLPSDRERVYPLACWVLLEYTTEDGEKHRYVDGLDEAHLPTTPSDEYCMDDVSWKEFRYLPERR